MQDIILPPFAPILMESTRAIGYSLEAAIADIIDNCIGALSSKITYNKVRKKEEGVGKPSGLR